MTTAMLNASVRGFVGHVYGNGDELVTLTLTREELEDIAVTLDESEDDVVPRMPRDRVEQYLELVDRISRYSIDNLSATTLAGIAETESRH